MTPVRRNLSLLLLCAALASCGREQAEFQIRFAAHYDGQPFRCDEAVGDVRLTDLRFFVSNMALVRPDGSWETLQLLPDDRWQLADVTLVDLENGSGDCQNGSAAMNDLVKGRAPSGDYAGLRFTLGVSESLNHGDPLIAKPPLTDTAMHWHWRSGYKFLRAGVLRGDERVRLHLGSARCHGVIGNLQGCDAGNRPKVVLQDFNFDNGLVVLDLASLLAPLERRDGALQVCEMGPDDAACDAFQIALGLDENGNSTEPSRIFQAVSGP
ncbi:MAG: MbnP family copper-binding protein [Woeseia sp.]